MKILIVAATKSEIEQERFQNCEMLITAVGMINTAIRLTQQLSHNDYDVVINMGVAGSFSDDFKLNQTLIYTTDMLFQN